jgi:hypothetical protein
MAKELKTLMGVVQTAEQKMCFIRTFEGDIALQELEIDASVLILFNELRDPHVTIAEFLSRYVIEAEIEEFRYDEFQLRDRALEDRIYMRASVKRVVQVERNCEWNKNVAALREFRDDESYAMVDKAICRFGPSFIVCRTIQFQTPVTPEEAYLFWATQENTYIRILELHLSNGLYFSGVHGNLKVSGKRPAMEFRVRGLSGKDSGPIANGPTGEGDGDRH